MLEKIKKFSSSNKKERVEFIWNSLKMYGTNPTIQSFSSCFGEGENIFVQMGNSRNVIVISAHYDGDTYFDNNSGVIMLLELMKDLLSLNMNSSLVVLFTDQEESYQRGTYYFIKLFSRYNIKINLNIDGIGIGDELFSFEELGKFTHSDKNLLCDSNEFSKNNISAISLFSAFNRDYYHAKNKSTYSIFNKYNNEFYFRSKYNNKRIKIIYNKLWEQIQLIL